MGALQRIEPRQGGRLKGFTQMLRWALIFLVVALVAGLLGFTTLAGAATGIAKILFFVFLILFVVSLIMGRRVKA